MAANVRKSLAIIFFLSIIVSGFSFRVPTVQAFIGPDEEWIKLYEHYQYSVIETTDGGYVQTGAIFDFSNKNKDIIVQKVNNKGKVIWEKRFGESANDYGWHIQKTNDNGYIISAESVFAEGQKQAYVLKLDHNGIKEWERVVEDTVTSPGPIHQLADGNYIFVVALKSKGMTAIKLNSVGEVIGDIDINGKFGKGFSTSDQGFIIVGSSYIQKIDSSGDKVWEIDYHDGKKLIHSAVETSDGGVILTGDVSNKVFVSKLNHSGQLSWEKELSDGTSELTASQIIQASDGGYVLMGENSSMSDTNLFLLKMDSFGEKEWRDSYGTAPSAKAHGYSISQTSDGGFIIAGTIYPNKNNGFLLKLRGTPGRAEIKELIIGPYPVNLYAGETLQLHLQAKINETGILSVNDDANWAASDSSVVSVKNGKLLARSKGNAIVTAELQGHTVSVPVQVLDNPDSGYIPDMEWKKDYGSKTRDEEARFVQQTENGGYVVLGTKYTSGEPDMYFMKLDPLGLVMQEKTYGSSAAEFGVYAQQTNDGGYFLLGKTVSQRSTSESMYLIKIDQDGNKKWESKQSGKRAVYLQQAPDGGVIVVGAIRSSYRPDTGEGFVMKIDAQGRKQWEKRISKGTALSSRADSVVVLENGDMIVVANFQKNARDYYMQLMKYNARGVLEGQKVYQGFLGNILRTTSDGGYILAGTIGQFSGFFIDIGVLKLNSTFSVEWSSMMGSYNRYDYANDIRQTSNGEYILIGDTRYDEPQTGHIYRVKMMKLDSFGNVIYDTNLQRSFYDQTGYSVDITKDGGLIAAGKKYKGFGDSDDIVIYKFNPSSTEAASNVKGVSLDKHQASLVKGVDELTLVPTIFSSTPQNEELLKWHSSDSTIAAVDDGVVKPVRPGTATITVTTSDGRYKDSCIVTVEQMKVTSIEATPSTSKLKPGTSIPLNVAASLSNRRKLLITKGSTGVTYTSSDSNTVTVSADGILTAHELAKKGKRVTITVRYMNKTDRCTVTIN